MERSADGPPQASRNQAILAVDNLANKADYIELAIASRASGNLFW
jgi:hypothetical protein